MPKYYCDYCDTHLTHDSPSVRKTHNGGKKHKENVAMYYQQLQSQEYQRRVDVTVHTFNAGIKTGAIHPMMSVMGNSFMQPMGPPGFDKFYPGMPFPPMSMPPPGTFPLGTAPQIPNDLMPMPPGPPLASIPTFPPMGHPGQPMGHSHPNFQDHQRVSRFS